MKNLWLILLLISGFITNSYALEIEEKDIVKNKEPGYCLWTSLETLGNVHKIDKLQGLLAIREKMGTDIHRGPDGKNYIVHSAGGWPDVATRQLNALNVKYILYDNARNFPEFLRYADKYGVAIGVMTPEMGHHILILTKYDEKNKKVELYNTNDKKKYMGSMEWLHHYWTGFTIIVYK